MNRILLEVAITTSDEAKVAAEAGADRLELCSTLEVGGVTPSFGAFVAIREAVTIPVYVLLRPRPGGFTYTDAEFAILKHDAEWFLKHGANGIVCGFLTADGRIDRTRCAELAALAKGKAVFHRAFDFLPNRTDAMEELIGLGFERILTSGGAPTAVQGRGEIADLVQRAAGRIEILPAGGVRPENVPQLLSETGCKQVHASLRSVVADPTLAWNTKLKPQMGERKATDAKLVRAMRSILDRVGAT